MDLQVQFGSCRSKLVKAAALFCFATAGVLMVISLVGNGQPLTGTPAPSLMSFEVTRN